MLQRPDRIAADGKDSRGTSTTCSGSRAGATGRAYPVVTFLHIPTKTEQPGLTLPEARYTTSGHSGADAAASKRTKQWMTARAVVLVLRVRLRR
jgi:hypothetical protein